MSPGRCPVMLCCSLALCACASQPEDDVFEEFRRRQIEPLFERVDEDGDGRVGPEEFERNYAAVTWDFFDQNGDGFVTAAEWALEGRSERRDRWFRELDADHDERLTPDELEATRTPAGAARFFELMDRDRDGVITRGDLE